MKDHPHKKEPILILTHEFYPKRAGIAVYIGETVRAAVALGWEVEVWAPEPVESLQGKPRIYEKRKTVHRFEAYERLYQCGRAGDKVPRFKHRPADHES